ncbi:uncharacterized protein LOC126473788 [Schistocerca serialis cubense]|uniref:uncharacterized protein LOC126473788 n=1 Tax=Schistocerca serialis cubense TaxID=2023355 RepID=UPI00214EA7DE|nr:uncharacterized protein LOC126473788 [Schistocerca serialis cubense]
MQNIISAQKCDRDHNTNHADFSSSSLEEVPDCVLNHFKFLKFLYLNNNELKTLPDCLFQRLNSLKWLDVRNNHLTELPRTIGNHPFLEVILLQGNMIRKLPLELGLVPNLRGVQFTGNPIEYPPQDILDKGAQYILKFLNEEWKIQSELDIRPIVEPFYKTEDEKEGTNVTFHRAGRLKSKSAFSFSDHFKHSVPITRRLKTSLPSLSVISYSAKAEDTTLLVPTNSPTGNSGYELTVSDFRQSSDAGSACKVPPVLKNNKRGNTVTRAECEKKVYETLLRDLWITKIKFILEKQNEIIQKRRNTELLQQWRKDTEKLNQINRMHLENFKKHGLKIPFDTDEDYMKILSRSDLKNSLSRGRAIKSLTVHPMIKSISQEMSEILSVLDAVANKDIHTSLAPHTVQKTASDEIQKLRQLKKKLWALRLKSAEDRDFCTESKSAALSTTKTSNLERE